MKYIEDERETLTLNAINLIENYLKDNHPFIYRTSTTKEIKSWVEKQK